ncbi:hypothetical protein HNP40_002059 [Mycobacteroides chelonae]|nr:hypothetical protein [Mycobacteroides chelonae]
MILEDQLAEARAINTQLHSSLANRAPDRTRPLGPHAPAAETTTATSVVDPIFKYRGWLPRLTGQPTEILLGSETLDSLH